ncbi:hypothetical protein MTER_29740 [Mycolicibacter terrae]|uniref:Cytochrome P450 n=1 Tax=Mycolicibacter terrae TaxID=1788 RepID=A0AAD1MHH7_9MYCO|nr:hypothetical protein MTER_29740 [Mycolicibacter terrae]SNV62324.1 cytochrome P450 [Mycolicibacter terrae]
MRFSEILPSARASDRMADIRICAVRHGPREARRYNVEPTFIMRGLQDLHLEFDPVG